MPTAWRFDGRQRPKGMEEGFDGRCEAVQCRPIITWRLDLNQSAQRVDHFVLARLELGSNSGRDLPAARRTRHERIAARDASRTISRSVRALMRSNSGSNPMPGRSNGTGMAPA